MATLNPTALTLDDSAVVRVAVHDAPLVQQAQALVTATRASVGAAKSLYAPTIQAGGGYNWSNNGRVPGALNQGWVIQVGTSFPLFNGFIREDAVTQANVAADVATSSSADTRRFSRAEAQRLLGGLHVAEQDVALATEAVRLAMEDLRVISVRYRGGIATILDQLTSQQNLIQAELDLVSARFTYQVTRATLEALLGQEL
jgi:outer membrane protein TolC